jgi:ABC-type lipoprotein export system ATPase subunit
MKVYVNRFKCYGTQVVREFNVNELTLISGESGIGKSTLMEAILWCLYGGMQHIYPSGSPSTAKNPTYVILEFPGFAIRRSQPPNTIEVNINAESAAPAQRLENQAAQAYIESVFDNRDFFLSSSYIQQNTRCPLVTSSDKEKTQLLHDLAFGNQDQSQDPDLYLQRIESEMVGLKNHVAQETGKYNTLNQQYLYATQSQREVYMRWFNANTTLEVLTQQYHSATQQSKDLSLQIDGLKAKEVKYTTLSDQLKAIVLVKPPDLDLKQLDQDLNNIKESIKQFNATEQLKTEAREITATLSQFHPGDFETTPDQITALQERIDTIVAGVSLAKEIGFDYYKKDHYILECQKLLQRHQQSKIDHQKWLQRKIDVEAKYQEDIKAYEDTSKISHAKYLIDLETYQEALKTEQSTHSELLSHINSLNKEKQDKHEEQIAKRDLCQKDLQAYRSYQDYLKKLEIVEDLKTKLTALKGQIRSAEEGSDVVGRYIKEFLDPTKAKIGVHLHQLEMLHNQLHCPHCKLAVVLKDKKLEPGLTSLSTEQYNSLTALIKEYSDHLQRLGILQDQLSRLEYQLSSATASLGRVVDKVEMTAVAVVVDRLELSLLRYPTFTTKLKEPSWIPLRAPTLEALPPQPILSDTSTIDANVIKATNIVVDSANLTTLREKLKRLHLLPHFRSLKNRLEELNVITSTLGAGVGDRSLLELKQKESSILSVISDHGGALSKYEANVNQQRSLSEEMAKIAYDPQLLPNLQSELLSLTESLKMMVALGDAQRVYSAIEGQRLAVEAQKTALLGHLDYEANIQKIKAIIQELNSQTMEEVVETINYNVNLILNEIFEADIQVLLKTHKDLKTKACTKLQVNLQVMYKSQVYDSPYRLSGGEQDRISIALTLALAKMSSSPLLLLDECMAALNSELQERCLKIIARFLPNKTILHVCHSITKGTHHQVLELLQDF